MPWWYHGTNLSSSLRGESSGEIFPRLKRSPHTNEATGEETQQVIWEGGWLHPTDQWLLTVEKAWSPPKPGKELWSLPSSHFVYSVRGSSGLWRAFKGLRLRGPEAEVQAYQGKGKDGQERKGGKIRKLKKKGKIKVSRGVKEDGGKAREGWRSALTEPDCRHWLSVARVLMVCSAFSM